MVVQAGAGRAGEAGRGVNAGLSVVPLRQTPLMVTVSGINLANTDNGGRAAALTLTWAGEFPHSSLLITRNNAVMKNRKSTRTVSSLRKPQHRSRTDEVTT